MHTGRKFLTFSDLNCVSIEDGSLIRKRARDAYGQLDQTSLLSVLFDLVVSGMEIDIFDRQHDPESSSAVHVNGEPVASKSALKRRKKKNTQQFTKKFVSVTDSPLILSHFPPMPPEHSYLTTKVFTMSKRFMRSSYLPCLLNLYLSIADPASY